MPVKGMDISNHQADAGMDVERVVAENDFGFVFILTNDGTVVNRAFHAQADAAERAGATVRPYTYLRPNWAQTIDIHTSIVGDRYRESIVDVEEGSGGWNEVWAAHNRLWDNDRDTPLLYWPNFHWQAMGSPDLSPLAERVRGHWKSWYPDREWDWFDDAYDKVPAYPWNDARGGMPVRILQFTGTGRVAGYGSHVDLNLFPGSREELDDLLGGVLDMQLSDRMKNWWNQDVSLEDVFRYVDLRAAQAAEQSAANGVKLDALLGREAGGDVDEAELARQLLAQGLGSQLGGISDEQFDQLVTAVNDEADRRARRRAAVVVPPVNPDQPL
ncbi:hypothetical protein Lesp02_83930 [Lentzea sp. NBRC 105346]|nr:hypothetical protein Lesp02_83930 [Lentzea sp. NBRC 105346]